MIYAILIIAPVAAYLLFTKVANAIATKFERAL